MNPFEAGILAWEVGDRSAKTFQKLWAMVRLWECFFYVSDGYKVYPQFIPEEDHVVSKPYMNSGGGRKYPAQVLSSPIISKDVVLFELRQYAEILPQIVAPLPELWGNPSSYIFIPRFSNASYTNECFSSPTRIASAYQYLI